MMSFAVHSASFFRRSGYDDRHGVGGKMEKKRGKKRIFRGVRHVTAFP